MQFTPKHDFWSEEMKSQYVAGLTYTIRPGNAKLAEAVGQWIDQGKVIPGAAPAGLVSGKGE